SNDIGRETFYGLRSKSTVWAGTTSAARSAVWARAATIWSAPSWLWPAAIWSAPSWIRAGTVPGRSAYAWARVCTPTGSQEVITALALDYSCHHWGHRCPRLRGLCYSQCSRYRLFCKNRDRAYYDG